MFCQFCRDAFRSALQEGRVYQHHSEKALCLESAQSGCFLCTILWDSCQGLGKDTGFKKESRYGSFMRRLRKKLSRDPREWMLQEPLRWIGLTFTVSVSRYIDGNSEKDRRERRDYGKLVFRNYDGTGPRDLINIELAQTNGKSISLSEA